MTQEEKSKAYDEALKNMRKFRDALSNHEETDLWVLKKEIVTDIEYYFPELKESEDERVKRILHSISSKMSFHLRDIFTEDEFQCFDAWSNVWLEKQSMSQVRTGPEWVDTIDDACDKQYLEEYAHGEYCHERSFKWGFQEGVDWLEKYIKEDEK